MIRASAGVGLLLGARGTTDSPADLNGERVIDSAALGPLLAAWGQCPT